VISISHLAQIASKADHHYLVYKENDAKFTRSNIKQLSEKERMNEVAAMLSGASVSESAVRHAKELLNS
jgi:DNA repair protein RecN (Recombination protein N)